MYLLLAAAIEVQLLRYKPQYTWPGLVIILSGVPVYRLWQKSQSARMRKRTEKQG
jgi:APA family basic amino acid/polyamine antiporter